MTDGPNTPNNPLAGPRRRLPPWKKLLFSLISTVLFFALLESGLALVGITPAVDHSDPFVGFTGSSPLFVADSQSSAPSKMVTAPSKLDWFNEQRFTRRKADGTRRVFCLGGSTTYGRPYDDTTSFCGWLRELLPRVAPDSNWEIINAGGVSYASYRVARLTEELVQYEPDLLVVYTGHNEFLEDRTYGNLKRASALRQSLSATVTRTRTGTLVRKLLGDPFDPPRDSRFPMPDEVDTLLDHSVGPTTYERDPEQRRRILEHFKINLARIVAIARNVGAEVVLIAPASNLKDCAPFKSLHSDELPEQHLEQWLQLYEQARKLEQTGKLETALQTYRRAEKIDSQFAELHWRTGRVLLKLQRFNDARVAFARAVDEDICPLRAISEISRISHSTAARLHVPLVDFEKLVAGVSERDHGHDSPGDELFLDHVHPTIEANGRLAAAIVERLAESDIIRTRRKLDEQLLSDVSKTIESRIDKRQHAIALRNLAKVLNWAGKHLEAGSLAMRAVEQLPEDPESLVLSAAFLRETGRLDQAIKNYRSALRHRPTYATAHQMLGAALVDRGDLDEALKHFIEITRLDPNDAHAWQMIGAIHAEQHRFEDAIPFYESAVRLNPNDADIHYNLANTLNQVNGDLNKVEFHYLRAIALNPNDADAHNNLGVVLMQAGRMTEAADRFRDVLRLRPDDQMAAANLRDAESGGIKQKVRSDN